MKKQSKKIPDELIDVELLNMFREVCTDEESCINAVRDAKKAYFFLRAQNFISWDDDNEFMNEGLEN